MTIVDTLNEMWTGLLEIMTQFVIPDWNAIIGMLPLLVFLGIVGPLLTLLPLGIVIYQLRKPRVKGVAFEEGPTVAAIGADGRADLPARTATLPARWTRSTRPGPPGASAARTPWPSSARCVGWAAWPWSTPARTAVSCSRSSHARSSCTVRHPGRSPAALRSPDAARSMIRDTATVAPQPVTAFARLLTR